MKFLIMGMDERWHMVQDTLEQLGGAQVIWDEKKDHMDTYMRTIAAVKNEPAVIMEDDIVLCDNFKEKCLAAIAERPTDVIQFFSMRDKDLTVGSRYDNGFLMNQCHYLPAGFTDGYLKFSETWIPANKIDNPTGSDTMMCAYLKSIKKKYWIHVPSLVDHRVGKSAINPSRSSKRQSKTFKENFKEV